MLKDFPDVYENTVNVLSNPDATTQQKAEALLGYLSQGTIGVKLGASGAAGLTTQLVNAADKIPQGPITATIRAKIQLPLPSRSQIATLPPAGQQSALPPAMGSISKPLSTTPNRPGPISPLFSKTPPSTPAQTAQSTITPSIEVPTEPTALTPVRIAEVGVEQASKNALEQGLVDN